MPRGAAPRCPACPAGGSLSSVGGSVGTVAGPDLRRGFPPDSGREPGFLRRKPEERAPGALPPGPPFVMAHSLPLARFGVRGAAKRSLGYFGAHVRTLIWGAFCGSGVWGRTHFVAGEYRLRRLPLGGKLSPKVTDEGAILYPTFPCRRRDLSPRRFPFPAPLGESVAPSSAPVCALGHLWFMVASPGPDRTVPRTVRPPRGRLWA